MGILSAGLTMSDVERAINALEAKRIAKECKGK